MSISPALRRQLSYGLAAGLLLLLAAHPGLISRSLLYQVWTALVALVVIGLLLTRRLDGRLPLPLLLPTALWLGICAVSVGAGDKVDWSDLALPLSQALWLLCGWWMGRQPTILRPLGRALICGAALAGLYGLAQHFGADPLPPATPFGAAGRVVSVFANPNHFGDFVAASLPLGLVFFLRVGGRLQWGLGLVLAASYSGLLLSACRGAWWGAIGGALIVLIGLGRGPAGRQRRSWLALGILAIGLAVLTFGLARQPAMRSPDGPVSLGQRLLSSRHIVGPGAAGDSTVNHRYFIWSVTWEMVRQKPLLGLGYGSFGRHFVAFRDGFADAPRFLSLPWHQRHEATPYAHNEFLHLWAETGLAGLLAFVGLVAAGTLPALVRAWRQADLGLWAVLGLIAVLLIHSQVSYPLRLPLNGMLFWLALGAAFGWPPRAAAAPEG